MDTVISGLNHSGGLLAAYRKYPGKTSDADLSMLKFYASPSVESVGHHAWRSLVICLVVVSNMLNRVGQRL